LNTDEAFSNEVMEELTLSLVDDKLVQINARGLPRVLPFLNNRQIGFLTGEQLAAIPARGIPPNTMRDLTLSQCRALSFEQVCDFSTQQLRALRNALQSDQSVREPDLMQQQNENLLTFVNSLLPNGGGTDDLPPYSSAPV